MNTNQSFILEDNDDKISIVLLLRPTKEPKLQDDLWRILNLFLKCLLIKEPIKWCRLEPESNLSDTKFPEITFLGINFFPCWFFFLKKLIIFFLTSTGFCILDFTILSMKCKWWSTSCWREFLVCARWRLMGTTACLYLSWIFEEHGV